MSDTKVPARKANIRIDLQRTDDLSTRYGFNSEANVTFDVILPDALYEDDPAVIEQINRELSKYVALLLRTSSDNRRASQLQPPSTAVSSVLTGIEGAEVDSE